MFESFQMGVPGVALGLAWTQVGGKVGKPVTFFNGKQGGKARNPIGERLLI